MSGSRVRLQREVDVAAPADQVWDYVTDWPRQGDWVPQTRVERVDAEDRPTDALGGRFRAWSGVGPIGFWDPMTITVWQRSADGGGRCEVLHLGRVVRGEGEFTVLALDPGRSRFVWAEVLVIPGGRLGAWGWRLVRPVAERLIDHALRTMGRQVEAARP